MAEFNSAFRLAVSDLSRHRIRFNKIKHMSATMQTAAVDTINFKDIDKGYEPFLQALRSLGFDWQGSKADVLKGFFKVHDSDAQLFFRIPAAGSGQGDEALTELSVISDVWSGVSESLAVIRSKQPGKLIKVRSMQLDGNVLTFTVS